MKFTTRLIITCITVIVLPLSMLIAYYFLIDQDVSIPRDIMTIMFVSIFVVLLITSIILVFWLSHSFVRPMQDLKRGMNQIAEGNFDEPIYSKERGEIGKIFSDYEKMRLELKTSQETKINNERQNRELIRNISHDLKTPITSIKGYVEGIMDGVADSPEKMEKYIKTIYVKANDMDRLIDELTIYSRIDTNQVPYQMCIFDVGNYFEDCVEDVGFDLESKGIRLEYDNAVSSGVRLLADPEQIKRVINNIIGNSVKYKKDTDSEIKMKICDVGEYILVEIEDNGRGVPVGDVDKIFERFYRTDESRNSKEGGSGIGLAIAKKIIEDHGGKIWATGDEGKGLCIHFTLRKYSDPESAVAEKEETENEKNPLVILEKVVTITAKEIKTGAENASKGIKSGAESATKAVRAGMESIKNGDRDRGGKK